VRVANQDVSRLGLNYLPLIPVILDYVVSLSPQIPPQIVAD
jgi:hypothetical protein